jgi:hypothetical protein
MREQKNDFNRIKASLVAIVTQTLNRGINENGQTYQVKLDKNIYLRKLFKTQTEIEIPKYQGRPNFCRGLHLNKTTKVFALGIAQQVLHLENCIPVTSNLIFSYASTYTIGVNFSVGRIFLMSAPHDSVVGRSRGNTSFYPCASGRSDENGGLNMQSEQRVLQHACKRGPKKGD